MASGNTDDESVVFCSSASMLYQKRQVNVRNQKQNSWTHKLITAQ